MTKTKFRSTLDGQTIKQLLEYRREIADEMQELHDEKFCDGCTATADDEKDFNKLSREFDKANRAVESRKAAELVSTGGTDITQQPGWRAQQIRSGVPEDALHSPSTADLTFRGVNGEEIRAVRGVAPLSGGDSGLSIGRAVCALLGKGGDDARERRFLSEYSGEGGGFTVAPQVATGIINAARAQSVLFRAGATTIPMTSSELVFAKEVTPASMGWRAEGAPLLSTTVGFGAVVLRPKVVGCIVPITQELASDAANLPAAIQAMLAREMALSIDYAGLAGSGVDSQPLGILNTTGVQTQARSDEVLLPADVSRCDQKIREANGVPNGIIAHPKTWGWLDRAADGMGRWLALSPMTDPLAKFQSTQIPLTYGDGADETPIIVGDFTQAVYGLRTTLQLRIDDAAAFRDSGGTMKSAFQDLFVVVRAWARLDFVLARAEHFCVMTGNAVADLT